MSTTKTRRPLTGRDRAILTAVAAGRAEITCSCEPDLYVDGLCCCDQSTAHSLAHAGLIAAAMSGAQPGARVPAVLTASGAATLNQAVEPA
ncbi:MAG: hypothetical protein GEU86_21150 [Actinophytocola sp.]|nr:hypothetical protein [Actinophytocola sp.]